MLSHDFYYKAHNDMSYAKSQRGLNYDHPDAFDADLMIEHIRQLKEWKEIERPVYDFTIHNRVEEIGQVKPSKVVVGGGILILKIRSFWILNFGGDRCGCADYPQDFKRCAGGGA